VQTYLWEKARIPDSPALRWELQDRVATNQMPQKAVQYPYPIAASPKEIFIAVAGGEQSGHSYWLQHGSSGAIPQTKEIKLPPNWDELLKEAENDLGPSPAF
jgi:hypothetical protein